MDFIPARVRELSGRGGLFIITIITIIIIIIIIIIILTLQFLKKVSISVLCAPGNGRRPFLYHSKMADFKYFCVLSVFSWNKLT